jgi:O-antigen/teichoic acid export membrane protein
MKKYISFPKFVLFSEFINNFINYIPVFLLSKLTGPATVGLYNMSARMLGIPITTVSSAIGEVFRQKAAKEYNETGSCRATFLKTFKALSLISIIPFVVLIFWGGDIFGFIFGERWRQAGVFAQILGVMFYFRFIVSPLTYLYYIAGRQKEDFVLHLLMLLLGFLSILAAWYYFGTEQKMLLFYSLAYVLIYVIYFIRSLSFTEKK